ncbi:MAG: GNAT family N-acetyltransferase [Candidatus Moranbacteria bacterium]|nr:GNAT family N-acetyltransferase [Candidatus Moranbacteria bacterium]
MENTEFLKKYQQLQGGIMLDEIIDLKYARIGISHIDRAAFWNFSLIDRNIDNKELEEIESSMRSLDRKPTVYFENSENFSETANLLKRLGYGKSFEDSWMFWTGEEISDDRFHQVKKVKDEDDLAIFLDTFNNCFRKNDPQNPYGELGDYLKVAEKVWKDLHRSSRIEYFIAYKDDKPVAVATLTNRDGLGYISNVGSLKEVRGEGFGKLVTLYCVDKSIINGNETHFLATEENTYPNEFYKRIGFETRFTGVAYSKEQ